MTTPQADLFAEDDRERNALSLDKHAELRASLEATIARLEATASFPWSDPLDAAHEENRFQRDSSALGNEGAALWIRFDREMGRLFSSQAA